MVLETDRLYLQEMNQNDFHSLCKILQDEIWFMGSHIKRDPGDDWPMWTDYAAVERQGGT